MNIKTKMRNKELDKRRKKMKKDDNFGNRNFLPIGDGDESSDDLFEGFGVEDTVSFIEDLCYSFTPEQKHSFLSALGYKIKSRKGRKGEEDFNVALAPGEKKLPGKDNIDEVFAKEVSDSILNILLKYGRK